MKKSLKPLFEFYKVTTILKNRFIYLFLLSKLYNLTISFLSFGMSFIAIDHIIGSFIAGIAGILIGLEQNLEPTMGTNLIVKGFTAAIIGGVGNVYGAILGALLLGLAENFGIWYLPSGYKDAIAFIILFIFLLFKPKGLFGIKREGDREQ